ncbi:MAG: hypothetical protein A2252_06820 [Elusimicrobia bacterium RIFOXYA2_FULL_39_19]|nr:MAG: hypothetical protein A2252_06820 [Elusimicrobia bacterium RIFOXYA2_FULL_39_19]
MEAQENTGFVYKNLKWNMSMHMLDGIFFEIGMYFANTATVLPAFVAMLNSSPILIGLISSIRTVGWLFPQLFSAYFVEGLEFRKMVMFKIGLGQRLPWFFIFLFTMLFAKTNPEIVLIAFFVFFAVAMFSGGLNMPVWLDFVANTVPTEWRGRLFGIRSTIGGFLGIVVGLVVGYILEKFTFPDNFSICFFTYFIFATISIIFVMLVREPQQEKIRKHFSIAKYFNSVKGIIRNNRNYVNFIVGRILLTFISMAVAFYTLYGIKNLGAGGKEIGAFMVSSLLGSSLSYFFWGYLGDHKGHMLVIKWSSLVGIAAVFLAGMADTLYCLYAVFFLDGVYMAGQLISGFNLVMEFSSPEERPTYIGLTNTLIAPFGTAVPVLAGLLLARNIFSYSSIFVFSGIISLLGLLILTFMVVEPRHLKITLVEKREGV